MYITFRKYIYIVLLNEEYIIIQFIFSCRIYKVSFYKCLIYDYQRDDYYIFVALRVLSTFITINLFWLLLNILKM